MKTLHRRDLQSSQSDFQKELLLGRKRRLTRVLAFGLRHNPIALGITLDHRGWTDIHSLIRSLQNRVSWEDLRQSEIECLVREDAVSRFEITDGRIRALYGHSVPHIVPGKITPPPPLLFHATRAANFASIRRHGIAARSRSFAHLTSSLGYALNVKLDHERSGFHAILLGVTTRRATIPFYQASDVVWTAPFLVPQCLSLVFLDSSPEGYSLVPLQRNDSSLTSEQDVAFFLSLLRTETDGQ